MNKLIASVLAFHFFLSYSLIAQEDSTKLFQCPQMVKPIFKTNFFPILWGAVPLTAEFRLVAEVAVARNQSSQIGISYLGKSPVFKAFEHLVMGNNSGPDILVQGYRLQLSHKFYLSEILNQSGLLSNSYNLAPFGFYLSPHASYATARISTRHLNNYNNFYRGTHINLNMLGGIQLQLFDEFIVDIYGGLGYKKNTWEDVQSGNSSAIDTQEFGYLYNMPLKINFGFNAGLAF
jgi:hypothetical protein